MNASLTRTEEIWRAEKKNLTRPSLSYYIKNWKSSLITIIFTIFATYHHIPPSSPPDCSKLTILCNENFFSHL